METPVSTTQLTILLEELILLLMLLDLMGVLIKIMWMPCCIMLMRSACHETAVSLMKEIL
jgi:hypothetical protein